MKLCALGFILIVATLVGFSCMASYDDQNWKIALASQESLSDAPAAPPTHFTLTGNDPTSRRKRTELSLDALGLAGIGLFITGIVSHLRHTNAAGLSK